MNEVKISPLKLMNFLKPSDEVVSIIKICLDLHHNHGALCYGNIMLNESFMKGLEWYLNARKCIRCASMSQKVTYTVKKLHFTN